MSISRSYVIEFIIIKILRFSKFQNIRTINLYEIYTEIDYIRILTRLEISDLMMALAGT